MAATSSLPAKAAYPAPVTPDNLRDATGAAYRCLDAALDLCLTLRDAAHQLDEPEGVSGFVRQTSDWWRALHAILVAPGNYGLHWQALEIVGTATIKELPPLSFGEPRPATAHEAVFRIAATLDLDYETILGTTGWETAADRTSECRRLVREAEALNSPRLSELRQRLDHEYLFAARWLADHPAELKQAGDAPASDSKKLDSLLSTLAEKGAILTGDSARAKDWAAAVRLTAHSTCSPSTVGKTKFWEKCGRKGCRLTSDGPAVSLPEAGVADPEIPPALRDEVEEKAVKAVMDSEAMPEAEKASIIRQLRVGEMPAAQALSLVREAASHQRDLEPSPCDPDPPDRAERLRQRNRLRHRKRL